MKCFNCGNKLGKNEVWCNMECKKNFLLRYYSPELTKIWFAESEELFKVRQKAVLKEIGQSGLTVSEFLRNLGEFNDVEITE